jgi:hypothetical protein
MEKRNINRCSFGRCFQQAVLYNRQSVLLGKDETCQQYVFRVYNACMHHSLYYARFDGLWFYQQEKRRGLQRMFFLMTPQHIALAKHLYIVWYDDNGSGAPGASTTRPYGNSDVLSDVAKAIGYRPYKDYDDFYSSDEEAYLEGLHQEMHLVLQIFLHTGQMKPGIYKKPDVSEDWVPVEYPEEEPELILALEKSEEPKPYLNWRHYLVNGVSQLREQGFSQTEIRRRMELGTREILQEMKLLASHEDVSAFLPQFAALLNEVIEEEC